MESGVRIETHAGSIDPQEITFKTYYDYPELAAASVSTPRLVTVFVAFRACLIFIERRCVSGVTGP